MVTRYALALLALIATATPAASQQAPEPLRIFLRAGPKTHGPGEHDHPRFLEEWSVLLAERGARVDGALRFPTAAELERTDVLVMYAAEGGTVAPEDRVNLAAYLARGGGIVALHDAVCGEDPQWFKTVIGGAWEHGHSKWEIGEQGLYFTDAQSPITRGTANFDLLDEIYYDLHLVPGARVLATSFRTPFDVEPQLWTYEPGSYRAFVSIQGHFYETFSNPAWRTLLLRGIAWAGGREVDELTTPEEVRGLSYPPGGPTAPELAAESFVLHPGFEIELVAAEPLVANPISIDWDASGRLWVATTPGYPYKAEFSGVPAHDEVSILEDSDGDGRMDQRKTFAAGLDLVTSLVFHGDGVIVTQAPEILWLRDRDGDDVADERVVLYSGFGYSDTHAVMSNLRRGADGWIYGTQGYSGNGSRHIVGASGMDLGAIGNGVFRFRPDGSAIEVVSSYGSNTWGLDFDPDGELLFSMANGSHLRHVVLPERALAGGRVGGVNSWLHLPDHRQVRPLIEPTRAVYQQIDFVGGFTAASGALVYDGGAWPAEFRGDAFVCEPTVCLVHRDHLSTKGVSFTASKPREAEFLASRDLWFRPVHLRTGPDGALYVLDFYNQAAVHNDTRGPKHGPTNAAVRPDRDARHGRIWRVQHEDAPAVAAIAAPDDVDALVLALTSANSWQRETAQRRLEELDGPRTHARIVERVTRLFDAGAPPAARLRVLWLVHALEPRADATRELVERGLADADGGVRRNAARVAALLPSSESLVRRLVDMATHDQDARARLLALTALAGDELEPGAVPGLVASYERLEDDWSRTMCLEALAGRAGEALSAALREESAGLASELARRLGRRGDAGEVDAFLSACDGQAADVLAPALHALEAALPEDFAPRTSDATLAALEALLESDEPRLITAGLALAVRLDTRGALSSARAALGARLQARLDDQQTDYATALGCFEALLALPEFRAAALARAPQFLVASAPLEIQTRAIASLAGISDRAAGACLAGSLPAMSAAARELALAALLARDEWADALLDELEAQRVRAIDLGPRALHSLKQHPTAALAARARELLTNPDDADVEKLIARLLPLVSEGGDATRGAALFEEHCGICHSFEGRGAAIGPDLTGMGAHGPRGLLPLIVDPNRTVDPSYLEYVVRRFDGTTVTGLIVRETAESVVLRSTAGDVEVPRAEIEELRSSGLSLMPMGLETLGSDVLRDVLAFLCEGYRGFRILDFSGLMNANSAEGICDPQKDSLPYRFVRTGVIEVEGVPFLLVDPYKAPGGSNVLILKGGPYEDWRCKRDAPRRVELALEGDVGRVHVLGGVAGWGYPWGEGEGQPIVRWVWEYEDGSEEECVLRNGVEFADWIGRYDVPGSRWVEGVVAEDSYGQLRTFSVAPGEEKRVRGLVLESYDNHLAPEFMGLTVESREHVRGGELEAEAREETVLVLCTNQALEEVTRGRIESHVRAGGGMLALHAGTWRNWAGWEAMSGEMLGAGAVSHEALGEFDVVWTEAGRRWIGEGRREAEGFSVRDELYRVEVDEGVAGSGLEVMAEGVSRVSGERYPVVWIVEVEGRRVVGCSLGHDGSAHRHPGYRRVLRRAIEWLREGD